MEYKVDKIKQFVLLNKYNLLLIFVYLIITLFTAINHEVWRDEAQVWCLLRDLNFFDALNAAKDEGHPFLWYILIFPFAKLHFPVFSMQFISWLFISVSIIYFAIKSPFNYLFKTIFIFSAGMTYYLPVVARNYALIPIFLFILADLYKQRNEKPIQYCVFIFLLSQTHALICGLSGALFLLFAFEKVKEYILTNKSNGIIPIGILGLYFLIFPLLYVSVPNDNGIIKSYITYDNSGLYDTFHMFLFHYWYFNSDNFLSFNTHPRLLELFFLCSLLVIMWRFFVLDKKIFFIFTFSFTYIIAILNRIWFGGIFYQKIFVAFLVLAFCIWILQNENKMVKEKLLKTVVYLLFLISTIVSFSVISSEIKYNFSGSKQIAKYIKENLNDEDTFVSVGFPFMFSPISAYLPDKKFYLTEIGTYLSFFYFNKNKEATFDEFPEYARYFIVPNDFSLDDDSRFKKIFMTDVENLSGVAQQEVYSIYYKLD